MKKLLILLSLVAMSLSIVSCGMFGRSNDMPVSENAKKEQRQEIVFTPVSDTIANEVQSQDTVSVPISDTIANEVQSQEPMSITAPAPKPNKKCVYANAYDGFVNVRAQPSVKAEKLGALKNGPDYLVQLGVQGKWIKVKWQNTVGYVDRSLVGRTPWKPVTLSVDADWIEGQYSMNHSDLFIFNNGRFIEFYKTCAVTYGTWRFEGNEIVITTKYITGSGKYFMDEGFGSFALGEEGRMLVDEQKHEIGGMFRTELSPKKEFDDEGFEASSEWPHGHVFVLDGESICISKEGFMMYKQDAAKRISLK